MSFQMKWFGEQAKRSVHDAAARGLLKGAEHILEESRRLVPIEEATLERSGATSVDDSKLVAAVSYDTPYAVPQHEELSFHHDPGRQAKYLETPMNGAPGLKAMEIVAREVKSELGA